MPDWLWFVGFFAAYIVLMHRVLPRLDVAGSSLDPQKATKSSTRQTNESWRGSW